MQENLAKSLAELIDETLAEIEDLKKGRLEAETITMGHEANGSMKKEEDAKDDEAEEEAEEAEEEAHKSEDDKDDAKDEDKDDDKGVEEDVEARMKKAEAKLAKAKAKHEKAAMKMEMCKAEWEKKSGAKHKPLAKTEAGAEDLRKAVEERVAPIESKLAEITDLVKKIADAPVPSRGASFKDVKALAKSNEVEPLSKSSVVNQLVELKKSGKDVDSADIIKIELGGQGDLADVANKYGIK